MTTAQQVRQWIEQHPETDSTPRRELSRRIAEELGVSAETARTAMRRTHGVEDPRDSYQYADGTYSVTLGAQRLELAADEVAHYVRAYAYAGLRLTQRQVARLACSEYGREWTHATVRRLLRVLGCDKNSAPLAPHQVEQLPVAEAVEAWREVKEAQIESAHRATEAEHYRSSYERERAQRLDLQAIVRGAVAAGAGLPALPARVVRTPDSEQTAIVLLSDWHVGACDEVFGVEVIRERVASVSAKIARVVRDCGHVAVLVLGDMLDGAGEEMRDGQKAEQDLHYQKQMAECARLIAHSVRTIAPDVVHTIAGNHGRSTKDRKSDPRRVLEWATYMIAEGYAGGTWQHHTQWVASLDLAGERVLMTHGDRAVKDPRKLAWGHAALGRTLIVQGHLHHLSVVEDGPITHVIAPSLRGNDEYGSALGHRSQAAQCVILLDADGYSVKKVAA